MVGRNLVYAGQRLYLGRLEARDDLGALVWQAGEGARVHRRLRQRCRGVSGARDKKHLFGRTEALRLSLRSLRRVESCSFFCSSCYMAVSLRKQLFGVGGRCGSVFTWKSTGVSSNKTKSLMLRGPEIAPANRPGAFSSRDEEREASGLISTKPVPLMPSFWQRTKIDLLIA